MVNFWNILPKSAYVIKCQQDLSHVFENCVVPRLFINNAKNTQETVK